jgi:zona occludens toxin (predicted ATPase)
MMRMLLLVFVLGAVWYLWKLVTEQKAAADAKDAEADPATPAADEAANTAECPLCKAYVSINAEGGCGREECPIPELAAVAAEAHAQAKADEAPKP